MNSYCYDTKIGRICITEDDIGISCVSMSCNDFSNLKETDLIRKTYIQISEFLDCKREIFDIPLSLKGTEFQKSVWTELLKIPYGKTCCYSDIAKKIKNPKASRAVGGACNKNPIMIIVPCHRVICRNGSINGYAQGVNIKSKLLNIEKTLIKT
ncbi:MAG: methylated-DNA--[protein]-cysteine S-methyltransferase [Clostridiaceae bacterium]|jgi:methylated-DNA-[protein]-cysteine S-methyltransferase|nr:methylated-DNA--[protein]-cysteine S-methyltransferase [Clostridiaceae bacterium]